MKIKETVAKFKSFAQSPKWSQLPRELLEMASSEGEEREAIIKNFFSYLDTIDEKYVDSFAELEPTEENFIAVFYIISQTEFLKAWTFALVSFNYAKAVMDIRQQNNPSYIR